MTQKTILVLTLLFGANAHASLTMRPVAESTPHYNWFCTADGYDYNGERRSISGGLKSSKEQAEQDALRACQGFFMACQVGSCFQEP